MTRGFSTRKRSFVQSLGQNPGIEQELQSLGTQAHVYVGTGIGAGASPGGSLGSR